MTATKFYIVLGLITSALLILTLMILLLRPEAYQLTASNAVFVFGLILCPASAAAVHGNDLRLET